MDSAFIKRKCFMYLVNKYLECYILNTYTGYKKDKIDFEEALAQKDKCLSFIEK